MAFYVSNSRKWPAMDGHITKNGENMQNVEALAERIFVLQQYSKVTGVFTYRLQKDLLAPLTEAEHTKVLKAVTVKHIAAALSGQSVEAK